MAKSKASSTAKPAKSQEYVNDSSSESSSPHISKKSEKRPKSKNSPESSSDAESSSPSDNESEGEQSSSSSASDTSTAAKRKVGTLESNSEPSRKKSKITSSVPSRRGLNPFKPPPGYEAVGSSATDFVSEAASMFSDLDGKQIWHITVPASVPITSIKQLDISAALHGEPILEYKGASYNMFAAPSKGEMLLLPGGTDNTYAKAATGVSRSFHLREVPHNTPRSKVFDGSNSSGEPKSDVIDIEQHDHQFFAVKEGVRRPPREQPSGLLMRYQPYGIEAASNRPYLLQHPDTVEIAEEESYENVLKVPSSYGEDGLDSPLKSSKKRKEGKRSKNEGSSQTNGTSMNTMMDVDIGNNSVMTTPSRSKTKKANPESEKKKKKDRKEKS